MKFFEISGDDWSSVFCFCLLPRARLLVHAVKLGPTQNLFDVLALCRRAAASVQIALQKAKLHLSFPAMQASLYVKKIFLAMENLAPCRARACLLNHCVHGEFLPYN